MIRRPPRSTLDRSSAASDVYKRQIEIFPATSSGTLTIPFSEMVAIAFTGEDTATGKSWEAWSAKKESERRKDIDRAAAEAKSRGHL